MSTGDLLMASPLETLAMFDGAPPPAVSDGGPLEIPQAAPRTLSEALLRTALDKPDKGLRLIDADGRETRQTYPMLLDRARRILTGLRDCGIKPRQGVILQIERLEDHFASFWACVLGGMIPVTVAIPSSYKQKDGVVGKLYHTWKLLNGAPILTNDHLLDSVVELETTAGMAGLKILSINELAKRVPASDLHEALPDEPFFYQLTSGSTGVPKCIQETHRSVIAHLHGSRQFCGYGDNEVTLNWLPFDHVVPILTFHLRDVYFGYDQVHVKPDRVLANPGIWLELIERYRVTLTWAPNFGFKRVSDFLKQHPGRKYDLGSIRYFMNAGEQVTGPVVKEFLHQVMPFGVKESAMQPAFGMAEVCTCMTYTNDFSITRSPRRFAKNSLGDVLREVCTGNEPASEFVDLGAPIPGVAIRIANSRNEVVPERVIGRLQIKGTVVTPGYLHNLDANRESFVGDGWFNAGDLGFILDGRLFLTGREKEMIVIRGAKFYCYEIEDVVNGIAGVEPTFAAACSAADSETGTEMLSIFFVPKAGVDPRQVSQSIRARVTVAFGISPGVVVPLPRNEFPKTTSGKIQRTQLKQNLARGLYDPILERLQSDTSPEDPSSQPVNDLERAVQMIWREVLGEVRFGTETSLFEIGGDSLKASQILSRVREQFGVALPLPAIFEEARTISGMARWIEKLQHNAIPVKTINALTPISRDGELPVSFGQEQLWILEQLEPGTSLYNISRAVELSGKLDVSALEGALNDIVQRHEILRSNLRFETRLHLVIRPHTPFSLPVMDFTGMPREQRRVLAFCTAENEARIPFQIANCPLVRCKLLRLAEEEHLLLLTFHQAVIDGWSVDVVLRELEQLYAARVNGEAAPLPPLTLQYADFAAWQRKQLDERTEQQQLGYWKEQLSDLPPPLKLAGQNDSSDPGRKAAVDRLVLTGDLVHQLREFNRRENSTLFVTALAAYKILLARNSGRDDIVVGIPRNSRNAPELERMVGFFVNTLAVRSRLDLSIPFRDFVQALRANTVQAVAYSDVPFHQVVQAIRRRGNVPLFQVWFGAIDSLRPFSMGSVRAVPHFVSPGTAQFDLAVFVAEQPDAITCLFEYRTSLFSQETVRGLMNQFEQVLRRAVSSPETPLKNLV